MTHTTRVVEVTKGAGPNGYGFYDEPYPYTQAGGHPQGLTITLAFASEQTPSGGRTPTRDPRDVVIGTPPGLAADPAGLPRCPVRLAFDEGQACPADTQVGVFVVRTGGGAQLGPIVDVVPEAGAAVELGLETPLGTFALVGRLTSAPGGYGLALIGRGFPAFGLLGLEATLWGVPGGPVHDAERGLSCKQQGAGAWECEDGGEPSGAPATPFLTMGSGCAAGAQAVSAYARSWQEPQVWAQAQALSPPLSGCGQLAFDPKLALQADTPLAEAPAGVDMSIEQPSLAGAQGTASPPLRFATASLPAGLSLNVAGADGLEACAASGAQGIDIPTGLGPGGLPPSPGEAGEGEEIGPDGLKRLAPGHCPEASVIGSAEALTPALARPLHGRVYLAAPRCGAAGQSACTAADALDGGLYGLYVELGGREETGETGASELPGAQGAIVKLRAELRVQPTTGQIVVRIDEAPQLPLSRLSISLKGGPRALLANPAACGQAATSADLTPWSAPGTTPEGLLVAGTADAAPSSRYEVAGCGAPSSFAPALVAGTQDPLAGSASPLAVSVLRGDREPYLSQVQVRLPSGLLGVVAGVGRCPAQAAAVGDCPPGSRIGSSLVAAGAGSAPLQLGGEVYLTGPYEGAPFGLAIVTDAVAGPFDLGRLVLRARVEIDARTGALAIATDPLPQILLGMPLRLRRVTLALDRPGFTVNPTGCAAKRIQATIVGVGAGVGAGAGGEVASSVWSPFAATGCRKLPFHPRLGAFASAARPRGGRSRGALLELTVAQAAGQANLAELALQLPRRLSVRGSALERSCGEAQFLLDPAACPPGSVAGYAVVHTPVLAGPLAGPAMLVARPGREFPKLEIVLQGEGAQLLLSGATRVSRAGRISARFDALPDLPIRRLELVLSQGPHSSLVANRRLCARPGMVMPTEAVGQNGAVVRRSTRVVVGGLTTAAPHYSSHGRSKRLARDGDGKQASRDAPAPACPS